MVGLNEHYKTLSAVFPIILREEQGKTSVLLHRRANTGYMDGKWDFAGSGHVEEKETAKMALIRECREEISIEVAFPDIEFAHLFHRVQMRGGRTYYDIYFIVRRFRGIPEIAEPDKCSALSWFALDELPEDMIDIRRQALRNWLDHVPYSECFW